VNVAQARAGPGRGGRLPQGRTVALRCRSSFIGKGALDERKGALEENRLPKVWVQICESNPIARRPDLLGPLAADGERYHILRLPCLDRCTVCARQPYALVNGVLVTARTCEELAERIRLSSPLNTLSPGPPAPGEGGDGGGPG